MPSITIQILKSKNETLFSLLRNCSSVDASLRELTFQPGLNIFTVDTLHRAI
jgi:hypothetical protein